MNKPLRQRACRICGCTASQACMTDSGPCHWVEADLCSACGPGLFAQIDAALSQIYTREEAAQWLRSPHPMFGGETPERLLASNRGQDVLRNLMQLLEGVYL